MAKTALDRFKVMLEEHTDGGVTQRQYSMRDFLKLINEEPGTTGQHTLNLDVVAHGKETKIASLPKGAVIKSTHIKALEPLPEGVTASVGFKDGESFATAKGVKEKEHPTAGTTAGTKESKEAPKEMSKKVDEDKDVVLKLEGSKNGEGHFNVVIHYEKYNEA